MLFRPDQAYLDQPWVSVRTNRVDSNAVSVRDFDISQNDINAFYAKDYAVAQDFLSSWDWRAYRDRFR